MLQVTFEHSHWVQVPNRSNVGSSTGFSRHVKTHSRPIPSAGMNNVSLIGSLAVEPELVTGSAGREECLMRLVVPRRNLGGAREPGVIYVDVTTFGDQARRCGAELTAGARIGVSGTLERDDSLSNGPRRSRWEVHAHQVEFLDNAPPTAAASSD